MLVTMVDILKFQHRYKIQNTQFNRGLFSTICLAWDYVSISKSEKFELCKDVWLRFLRLKLAFH